MDIPPCWGSLEQAGWRSPGVERAVGRSPASPSSTGEVPWLELHPLAQGFSCSQGPSQELAAGLLDAGHTLGAQGGILAHRELQEGLGMEARKHKCRIPKRPIVGDQSQAANPEDAWLV